LLFLSKLIGGVVAEHPELLRLRRMLEDEAPMEQRCSATQSSCDGAKLETSKQPDVHLNVGATIAVAL
jgi:hypothetical protein